jgi:hypothetical protein
MYRQLWCSGLLHVATPAEKEITERRDARSREYQFLLKMAGFTKSWSALAREYNGKGTFNLKTVVAVVQVIGHQRWFTAATHVFPAELVRLACCARHLSLWLDLGDAY